MRVSPEKWKDLAVRGASLISQSGLLTPTNLDTLDCPYSAFCADVVVAALNEPRAKKPVAKKTDAYLPNQMCFSFDA